MVNVNSLIYVNVVMLLHFNYYFLLIVIIINSDSKMIFVVIQDLNKKFNETTQYKNMKQMLTSKNDQIKELRGRLRK